MSGKGDKQRKPQVPDKQVTDNWAQIFGKNKKDLNKDGNSMWEGESELPDLNRIHEIK